MRCVLREEIRNDNRILALASVGAGAIYFLVIIVTLNAYIDNKRRQKEPQLIRVIRDMKERMAMDEVHYLISDASRKVDVEAHVLRYWEEELELGIPRNEMGHRYYTDFHIRLFKQVKNLKEKGYQLKAIKHALEQMKKDGKLEGELTDELLERDMDAALKELKEEESTAMVAATGEGMALPASAEEKMAQFQQMMNLIIGRALEVNNEKLSQDISCLVKERLAGEMELLLKDSDQKEEERFRLLDETIRSFQKSGQEEAAAAKVPFFKKKRFGRGAKKLFHREKRS